MNEVFSIKTFLCSLLLIGTSPLAFAAALAGTGGAPPSPADELPSQTAAEPPRNTPVVTLSKGAPDTPVATQPAGDIDPASGLPDYSDFSHHDLTRLGTQWDELSSDQRMALLREVKLRMAQQKVPDGVLMIRSQRRYGRIVRQSDGRVLRIETQVVQVRPANPPQNPGQRSFGVGFERRTATGQTAAEVDDTESVEVTEVDGEVVVIPPPVMRASEPRP